MCPEDCQLNFLINNYIFILFISDCWVCYKKNLKKHVNTNLAARTSVRSAVIKYKSTPSDQSELNNLKLVFKSNSCAISDKSTNRLLQWCSLLAVEGLVKLATTLTPISFSTRVAMLILSINSKLLIHVSMLIKKLTENDLISGPLRGTEHLRGIWQVIVSQYSQRHSAYSYVTQLLAAWQHQDHTHTHSHTHLVSSSSFGCVWNYIMAATVSSLLRFQSFSVF